MDKIRLLKLANAIEGADQSATSEFAFDMDRFYDERNTTVHRCGTAACIQGWAQHIDPANKVWAERLDPIDMFARWCGVPYPTAYKICMPNTVSTRAVKPHHAAAMLRHFVATGDVVWALDGKQQPEGAP